MWRPTGWDKKRMGHKALVGTKLNLGISVSHVDSFEAGADAMLEALRKEGYRTYVDPDDNGICLSSKDIKGKSGTLVFIPDEEVEDAIT